MTDKKTKYTVVMTPETFKEIHQASTHSGPATPILDMFRRPDMYAITSSGNVLVQFTNNNNTIPMMSIVNRDKEIKDFFTKHASTSHIIIEQYHGDQKYTITSGTLADSDINIKLEVNVNTSGARSLKYGESLTPHKLFKEVLTTEEGYEYSFHTLSNLNLRLELDDGHDVIDSDLTVDDAIAIRSILDSYINLVKPVNKPSSGDIIMEDIQRTMNTHLKLED